MRRTFPIFLAFVMIAVAFLAGCNKKSAKAGGDAVDQKLQDVAGGGATDCGRLKSPTPDQMKAASNCAMGASQKKQAFYVAYDLPGLTVGVAAGSDGKSYAIQASTPENAQPGTPMEVKADPCPSDVRIAQSGRVTCTAPGSMGGMGMGSMGGMGGMGGESPHGGMTMPPPTGENPHGGGMMAPPAGAPNSNAGGATKQ
jgi:hypothetical protein